MLFVGSIDAWQELALTLRKNKLRTFLTGLSVAWGIFMLVLLLGSGNGLQNAVEYQFRDDALNSLRVFRGRTALPFEGHAPGRSVQFTNEDIDKIKLLPGLDRISARFEIPGEYLVAYGPKSAGFDVRSVHPDHQFIEKTVIVAGRFLNETDLSERRKVVVIGQGVKDFLFGDKPITEALGQFIQIAGISYRVIGLFEDIGGEGEQKKLYIPVSTAQLAHGGENRVNTILVTTQGESVEVSERVEKQLRQTLAELHHFDPEDKRAIRVSNNLKEFSEVRTVFWGIRVFVWFVGIGTIIAGIVGVSNIMLISVAERTKEFGIRKAIGATPWSIISMVLRESLVITAVSGFLGLVAAVFLLSFVSKNLPINDFFMNPDVDLSIAFSATGILVIAGLLAGFFPARRAATVEPAQALRDE